jgi:HSP20 family protein
MSDILHRDSLFNRLSRFDPFRDDDWFKGFWVRPLAGEPEAPPQIRIDLTENGQGYTVRAEIPGAKKEDIKVEVDGNRVSISAEVKREKEEKKDDKVIRRECYQGSSYRSFTLDSEVDEAKAEARYDNGVLELKLPKKATTATKRLTIS